MKFISLALFGIVSAANLKWKNCKNDQDVIIKDIIMTPDVPVGGAPMELKLSGAYNGNSALQAGTKLSVKVKTKGLIAFPFNMDLDMCSSVSDAELCPVNPGEFSTTVAKDLPAIPMSVAVGGTIDLVDHNNVKRGCVEVDFNLKKGSPPKAAPSKPAPSQAAPSKAAPSKPAPSKPAPTSANNKKTSRKAKDEL